MSATKIGVLLVNLGTPDQPTTTAIKRYLHQFLTDPRVIDLPRWQWLPLLNLIILPKRAPRVAKLYQQIWQAEGSPLLAISQQQKIALQQRFNSQQQNVVVELAMTYGNPSITAALTKLYQAKVERIILLPLYPQYSSTTTASVLDAFYKALQQQRCILPFDVIFSYHNHPLYIAALAKTVAQSKQADEHLLISFHGIPVRYQQEGDYYPEHCQQTADALAQQLNLSNDQWTLSYQSRFGKEEWLQPYTDETLLSLPKRNIKKVVVICPGFAADCLETLEEIAQENKRYFLQAGGESYRYIPALNANSDHIELLYQLIDEKLS
ncbi:ferrochelatase [Gallibacterium salpingitidis]|uniref:Ferrochelatase n=1 Tax=Gallibacterium salpingitidis TaxID=505341 RepID=A0A1A7P1D4_9PAST|nr:ferrochelatase [Gallibacterium salpingitidis]OBW95793.1 ferrochelatase [Gallibacterium salpingitidis]